MIPVYSIIEFNEELEGGANRPFIVRAIDSNNNYVGQFVVKIFDKNRIVQDNYVGKEFFCSHLATQLDIKTPGLVLLKIQEGINIPTSVVSKLVDYPFQAFLGVKYVDSVNQFTPSFSSKELSEYDIETIFAFDALIMNPDRSRLKPNLLIKNDAIFVIDHEYSLGWCKNNCDINVVNSQTVLLGANEERRHVFYDYLRRRHSDVTFETFTYYIENLNVNFFDGINNELVRHGYGLDYLQNIKSYITEVKSECSIFVDSIRQVIA